MELTNFLAQLAQALLIIAIPIVVAGAFMWTRQKAAEIKQNLSKEQLSMIEKGVHIAVKAAEQAGFSGILKSGIEKKEYAIDAVQRYLDRTGVAIDVEEIATLIEAEVNSQFTKYAPPVDTPEARSALIDKAVEAAVLAAEQSGLKKSRRRRRRQCGPFQERLCHQPGGKISGRTRPKNRHQPDRRPDRRPDHEAQGPGNQSQLRLIITA